MPIAETLIVEILITTAAVAAVGLFLSGLLTNFWHGYRTAEQWHADGMDLDVMEAEAGFWLGHQQGNAAFRAGFNAYIENARKHLNEERKSE